MAHIGVSEEQARALRDAEWLFKELGGAVVMDLPWTEVKRLSAACYRPLLPP